MYCALLTRRRPALERLASPQIGRLPSTTAGHLWALPFMPGGDMKQVACESICKPEVWARRLTARLHEGFPSISLWLVISRELGDSRLTSGICTESSPCAKPTGVPRG